MSPRKCLIVSHHFVCQGQMNFRRKSSSGSITAPPAPANTSVSKSATLVSPTSEDGDLAPPPAAFNEGATPLDPPEPSPQPDLIGGPAAPDIITERKEEATLMERRK